jgi:hypothetical protein
MQSPTEVLPGQQTRAAMDFVKRLPHFCGFNTAVMPTLRGFSLCFLPYLEQEKHRPSFAKINAMFETVSVNKNDEFAD